MDEIGSCIIPHPAAVQAESRIPQLRSAHARYANIDCLGLHVETVLRHAMAVGTKILIAPGCAVTAHNVDLGIGSSKGNGQIVQKIEYTGIVIASIAGTMIAQIGI